MPAPFPDKPFVGMPGSEKSVSISRQSDRIVCSLARHTFWFVQSILLLFGILSAYISWGFWATAEGADAPLYFRIFTPAFTLILWLVLFRNLLGPPRVEILLSTGDLLFFKRRTAQPAFTILKQDVMGFDLSEQFYGSLGENYWRNFVVSVSTVDGKRLALCASPNQKLMQSFVADLASILGVPRTDASV
jgi:hypothetical protein